MTVEDMIVEAGPLSDAIMSITGTDDGTMVITTRDNAMTLYAASKRIVFEVILGAPPAEHRERIYRALLTYNALWQDTGFVRMAIGNPGDGDVAILLADITIDADFSADYVVSVVEDLDAKATIWREIIERGADDGKNPDGTAGASFVRV